MIRSKKEFLCRICNTKYIKWQGVCSKCGEGGTIVEVSLLPVQVKPRATPSQKSLMRRSKTSERDIAKRMLSADGPDPAFKNIATSTGRIGHITNIRVDAVSLHYVTENKNRILPVWIRDAWILINQRAEDFNKYPLLHLDPPNFPKTIPINGQQKKLDSMAVITQTRHEELIQKERELEELQWTMKNSKK
jgi:hypothetical protein